MDLNIEGLPELVCVRVRAGHWKPDSLANELSRLLETNEAPPAEEAAIVLALLPETEDDDAPKLIEFLGKAKYRPAVAALRPYLRNTAKLPYGTRGLRLCDLASEALDKILGTKPRSPSLYALIVHGDSPDAQRARRDAHIEELLERTKE